jgi:uncharacterized protein HemX
MARRANTGIHVSETMCATGLGNLPQARRVSPPTLTIGDMIMAEERITEVQSPDGNTHTHTTVVTDGARSGGGGGMVLIALLVIVALVIGIWAFNKYGGAEANKDNAIANAANQVGDAAQKAGNAAQDAAH